MKVCKICKEEKDDDAYYKNNGECKRCHNKKRARWAPQCDGSKPHIDKVEKDLIIRYFNEGKTAKDIERLTKRSYPTLLKIKKEIQIEAEIQSVT